MKTAVMPKHAGDYHASLLKRLINPAIAENYMAEALEDSYEAFLIALRNVTESDETNLSTLENLNS